MARAAFYSPRQPSGERTPEAVERWARDEFETLSRMFTTGQVVQFQVLHVEPERPRQGMVVFADGTNWDPSDGEGLYVYKSGGWTFIV